MPKIAAVSGRCLPYALFEMSDKVAGIPKAAVLGDLLYALPGGAQQYFCMVDAVNRQIAVRCRPHDTPEGADKIIFGQRQCAQHIIDGNRLRIVRTDVLHRPWICAESSILSATVPLLSCARIPSSSCVKPCVFCTAMAVILAGYSTDSMALAATP